jgi:hypothetical protein
MKSILILLLLLVHLVPAYAQIDSTYLINKFIQIGNSYGQQPVHVKIRIEQQNNLVRNTADTATAEGFLYKSSLNEMYLSVYPFEQLIVDTVGIMVQHEQQRIYKVTDVERLRKQHLSYSNIRLRENDVNEYLNSYNISTSFHNGNPAISLIAKSAISNLPVPPMEVCLVYDSLEQKPLSITYTNRRLIPIHESDTSVFINKYGNSYIHQVQTSQESKWYFIQEQTVKLIYTAPHSNVDPVLSIGHFIVKDAQGVWTATERFKNYQVVVY